MDDKCRHCWNVFVASFVEIMYQVVMVLALGTERKSRVSSAVKGLRFAFMMKAPGQLGKDF